uniref:Regulatory protein E2 n=1 Tax=Barbastella barbastellus papillomavirus 1 TaxID=3139985 RepID=A0AAU6S4Y7_9PAPI
MSLSSRLDSIQEKILDLYEKDSDDIADHIKYWKLTRQEQALLYFARQQGHVTLGMHQIPALATTEARGKQAVEMSLYLESLAKSPYGREPWTLRETTRERLLAAPMYCFKKGGSPVEVIFDNDSNNGVEYTLWDKIYYQNGDGEWHKASGRVDLDGLYYEDNDGLKRYYEQFKEEAAKYSTTGSWSLVYANTLLKSVGSQESDSSEGPIHSPSASPQRRRATHSTPKPRGQQRQYPTTSSSAAAQREQRLGVREQQARGHRGGIRGELSLQEAGERRRRQRSRSRSRSPEQPATPERRRGRGGRSPRGGPGSTGVAPPSPEEVGASHRSVEGRSSGRLGRLLQEARDPPGLCLRGPANSLKCYRYTIKCKRLPCRLVSTTWSWTSCDTPDRVGDARMLILFDNTEQRALFLQKASFPKSVTVFDVSFNGV